MREALRTWHEPTARVIVQQAGANSTTTRRVSTLKALLQQAAAELQAAPRDLKLFRALQHTYFQPAATQGQAAKLLDLPFSTYRRHLASGIAYVVEGLWQQE